MNSALFHYRRKVAEDQINDNFINPLNVLSFYWSVNDNGQRVLSVFLSNGFSQVFGESVGERFVKHMEDFLCVMLSRPAVSEIPKTVTGKRSRNLHPAEIVEEEIPLETTPEVAWKD